MPTPFTHLLIAQRLLQDSALPKWQRDHFHAESGAFLLGNVAADARVGAGMPREHTHFYVYAQELNHCPWQRMMTLNPELWQPRDEAQRAFIAGYVAHLAVDEYWSRHMVAPYFVEREWGDRRLRFIMLHAILIYMDERDLPMLDEWQPGSLYSAQPANWVSFIPDEDLRGWQTLIHDQIRPDGASRTLEIFGGRIAWTVEELRALMDSEQRMQADLWDHIPKSVLAEVEAGMYTYARSQLQLYMERTVSPEP